MMLPGTESARGRIYPMCGLLPIERAGRYLLPPEVRANLRYGEPLLASATPHLYPDDWISAVFGYLLSQPTLYSGEAFRENIRQYIKTFQLHDWLPVIRKRVSQEDYMALSRRGFSSDAFITTHDIKPPERGRIWMQGRFNGPPHPAILETVLRIKKMLPGYEFYVGIDHDDTSMELGQNVFMDVQFRASLLYKTGLFDKIVLLKPPGKEYDSDGRDEWWDNLYAISGGLDPHVIVTSENEAIESIRQQQISVRTLSLSAESLPRIVRDMHQSTIKSGATPVEEVRRGWDVVRRLLGDPGET